MNPSQLMAKNDITESNDSYSCEYEDHLPVNQNIICDLSSVQISSQTPKPDPYSLQKCSEYNVIVPSNFIGINDYMEEAIKCKFSAHYINCNGTQRIAVTLEMLDHQPFKKYDFKLNPVDLHGLASDYYPEIRKSRFCWRYLDISEESSLRVVTLEDEPDLDEVLTCKFVKLQPAHFAGIESWFSYTHLQFYWRWAQLNTGWYRVLTLE